MFPYIIIFIVSLLCFRYTEQELKRKHFTIWGGVCVFLSAFFPIMLAAFRDEDIGADTSLYAIGAFNEVYNYKNISDVIKEGHLEPLYLIVAYIARFLSSEIWVFHMFIETLIVVPFYVGMFKMRNMLSPTFALFLFFCFFYNHSFNMMRQGVALAFVFLSVSYMLEHKWKVQWLLLLVAFGFHTSTLLAFLLPILFYFVRLFPYYKNRFLYLVLIIFAIVFVHSFANIMITMVGLNYLDDKYLIYTKEGVFKASISKSLLVIDVVEFLILYFFYKRTQAHGVIPTFFCMCSIFTVLFLFTGMIVNFLARTSWYFSIISLVSLPYCFHNTLQKKTPTQNIKIIFALLMCFYWWFAFVVNEESDTYPYRSEILGI